MKLLTVLSFSAGKQSSCLLWMLLRGEIPRPENLVVLRANPGMENTYSNLYAIKMRRRCEEAGIYYEDVKGPNLYKDMVTLTVRGATRLDNPPYWTKNPVTGKRGRLRQACTSFYKIAPMDRAIRRLLQERHGISRVSKRIPASSVEKWIGFSSDERDRMKDPDQKYVCFRYPLIELGMSKEAVEGYFTDRGIDAPPRSVCSACFANGLDTYKEMYQNRPLDWQRAVEVDRSVRDWKRIHVEHEVYVSPTLIPLERMPEYDFDVNKIRAAVAEGEVDRETLHFAPAGAETDEDGWSCDSGHCFL